jgi:hypothetical protein
MITIKNAIISCDEDRCDAQIETTIRRKGNYTGAGFWQFLSGDHYYGGSDSIPEGILVDWSIEQSTYNGKEYHFIYCPKHNSKKRSKSSIASSVVSSNGSAEMTYRKNSKGENVGGPIVDGIERCSPNNMTPRFSIYDPTSRSRE